MAQSLEIATIYIAGLIQGIALVTFPAASAVFTNQADYGLSDTDYGGTFAPQAVMAVLSSLLGAGLSRRLGLKHVYLLGLATNFLAMALLVLSKFVMHQHALAFGILLVATACMGIGFGFTVPALNTFTAAFFPRKVDKAILGLNALLGLGTALAPLFTALFVGWGIWWGLPVLVGSLILGLLLFSVNQLSEQGAGAHAQTSPKGKAKIPARFWVFATFALLYGVCETMNGNWASPYMTKHFGASVTTASLALTFFWGSVTAGRLFFSAVEKWLPEPIVCRVLPLVVAIAFVISACLPKTAPFAGLAAFALAGLGCSALLPLVISFSQKELTTMTGTVAGGLIAFYQAGYGIAAFGVGPLQNSTGLNLNIIFGGTVVAAIVMWILSFVIVRTKAAMLHK